MKPEDSIYVDKDDRPKERFVVMLAVGYSVEELTIGKEVPPGELRLEAAAAALSLTRDLGSDGTHWLVQDVTDGSVHTIEQADFEGRCPEGVTNA
jgi:hypothetical protein